MKVKVVFHINSDSETPLRTAFGNVSNLLKEEKVIKNGAEVTILLNGPGILRLKKNADSSDLETAGVLAEKGVKFKICNNSLIKFNLLKNDMHPACEVVSAGIMELIKLQDSGYAYIKP